MSSTGTSTNAASSSYADALRRPTVAAQPDGKPPPPDPKIPYKTLHTFEDRCAESRRVKTKHPSMIPVICERVRNTRTSQDVLPYIDKKKFLVPKDLTCGQLMYVIRKRVSMPAHSALFIYVDEGILPSTSQLVSQLSTEHEDPDGFLYFTYSGENTFG